MTEESKMTKEQQREVDLVVKLLAQSDQWVNYIGSEKNTKKLDGLIKRGKYFLAFTFLQWSNELGLSEHLRRVAIKARAEYLDSRDKITKEAKMKITVTELTEGVETHKMVVEADKTIISKTVDEHIQQRVEELGLVLDYCIYLSPEGKQVKFPLTLELIDNQKEVAALLEGCPTEDQEGYLSSHLIPIGDAAKEAVQLGQEEWIKTYYPDNNHPEGWAEGRGYD